MRHGKKVNHLGRTAAHRHALLSNMASSLILKKRITTTVSKAKELRKYVEPLITKAKTDSTHSRRVVFSYLQNKESVSTLFGEVAGRTSERKGGYTRIIKLGTRPGDNAELGMIELVDFNEIYGKGTTAVAEPAKKTRRAGGAKKKATTDAPAAEATDTTATDTPAEGKA